MQADSILGVILRVIQRSERSSAQLLSGMIWRIAERLLDVLPMLVCFWWLQAVLMADVGGTGEVTPSIAMVTALLVGIFSLQLFCAIHGQKNSFLGSYSIMGGYREKLLDRAHQLPLGALYRYRTGQLTDMVTDDVLRVENIFTHLVIEVLTTLLIPVVLVAGLMWVDWQLALSLIIGMPFAFWVLQVTRKLFVRMSQDKQAVYRDTSGLIVEFVSGIKTLRFYHRAELWLGKLYRHFDEMIRMSIKVEQWGAVPVVLYRLLLELGLVVFFLIAANKIDAGSASPLTLLLFMLLAHRVISPLLEMGQHLTILRYAVQCEGKLQGLYDEALLSEPEKAAGITEYSVCFDGVSFGYESMPVLHNISFTARHQAVTAIVGPSGSGKSTVMNLLARFYDPDQGTIRVGGKDVKALGSEGLYQHISMVFQQVQLFDGTIMDNVRIGRPSASDEDVFAACKMAYCGEFINRLPAGYQTLIGESGASLSGGERQRLSIARALLKDAPIILLDEATASVDAITQHYIQQALSELVKDKTVIMIAHRLSTIRDADQILVLDSGQLVQRGCHDELLKQEGLYQELWSAQNGVLTT
ncbi:ABC transporter ATP-binding protein [Photobacterium atrarenae]|uniref:ABC transporter ATP-binding protein/permease n=1 Tax=Photobacterium atrarenae TaxID=865757 RepID=A0ABY5GLK9_9GAMM|nr:ABC transporter ATP-binding protein [Photobacterium atrarenae]UTV29666.1 ABC transporter ATP-binding protein/permease [Photobacterium atrarenae]